MRSSRNAVPRWTTGSTQVNATGGSPPRSSTSKPRLRKVMGYRHLPRLREALKRELKHRYHDEDESCVVRSRGEFQLRMGLTPESPKCAYRFAIRVVVAGLHPISDATTGSGTPRSRSRVMQVCRRSWNRHWTSPALRAEVHATFQDVMGRRRVGAVYLCSLAVSAETNPLAWKHIVLGCTPWKLLCPGREHLCSCLVQRNDSAFAARCL